MGDLIVAPKGPKITVVDQRLVILPTPVWQRHAALRADAQTLPSRPGFASEGIAWTSQSTATWTTVETRSARHIHLRTLATQWLARGVFIVDLASSAPRCHACGCVEQIACADRCSWSGHTESGWLCSTCMRSMIRRGAR